MTHIFFFSSRRRHTRLQGDWSSDVCSSDLGAREPERQADGRRRSGLSGEEQEWTGPAELPDQVEQQDRAPLGCDRRRSEEHTSELQSPCNLVCRLLLEKKNNSMNHTTHITT